MYSKKDYRYSSVNIHSFLMKRANLTKFAWSDKKQAIADFCFTVFRKRLEEVKARLYLYRPLFTPSNGFRPFAISIQHNTPIVFWHLSIIFFADSEYPEMGSYIQELLLYPVICIGNEQHQVTEA